MRARFGFGAPGGRVGGDAARASEVTTGIGPAPAARRLPDVGPAEDRAAARKIGVWDSIRGLAACGVAFGYHYTQFNVITAAQRIPVWRWFFSSGWMMVDVFFLISGLVFCHVYLDKRVRARDFFCLRFSRLYPVHLVT